MEQTKQVLSLSPLFNWEDRIAVIDEIAAEKGTATTVKITLRGTMGKYVDEGACIVGVMQHTGEKLPTLPAGPTRCATRWSPQAEKWQS